MVDMTLRTLSAGMKLKGKRVLVRVDWNVPLLGGWQPEESLKIERSLSTIHALQKRGAVIIALTHIGRPEGREHKYSTEHLIPLLAARYKLHAAYHSASVSRKDEFALLQEALSEAAPGSVHLLENVRFENGEEKNDPKLAKAYAALGQLFINDAFASSHRSHASVVGIAKQLPAYAGPALAEEVGVLQRLVQKPGKPFLAIIGGLKLSTKIPVLESL